MYGGVSESGSPVLSGMRSPNANGGMAERALDTLAQIQWARSLFIFVGALALVVHVLYALTHELFRMPILFTVLLFFILIDCLLQMWLELPRKNIPEPLQGWIMRYVRFVWDPRGRAVELFGDGLLVLLMGGVSAGVCCMASSLLSLVLGQLCADRVRVKLAEVGAGCLCITLFTPLHVLLL